MFNETNLMFMICESPLHAGSGSELDYIDMPIQRERHTQFPKIESSSLKGAIRERFYPTRSTLQIPNGCSATHDQLFAAAFGGITKQPTTGDERQGGLAFSDARLLLFPVKSMVGVFAWITCPFVLERFATDLKRAGQVQAISGQFIPEPGNAIVFSGSSLLFKNNIILEEYPFIKQDADPELKIDGSALNKWLAEKLFGFAQNFWKIHLEKNLVIISDDDFADFTEMSTEVITRTSINPETGNVKGTALFTEEYLPTDSVLYSLVMAHGEFIAKDKLTQNGTTRTRIEADDLMRFFTESMNGSLNNAFQAGGNATIGKGLIRTGLLNGVPVGAGVPGPTGTNANDQVANADTGNNKPTTSSEGKETAEILST